VVVAFEGITILIVGVNITRIVYTKNHRDFLVWMSKLVIKGVLVAGFTVTIKNLYSKLLIMNLKYNLWHF
jgi:hypothetical protein